ncbi:hypothetical protein ACFXG4_04035 [Nocardia sp. NPDC059246]|uniref:hypothetical protein n=1 Tax=unclassified Nocardia TaxID=2637762 RepID=UPI0036838166
MEWLSFAKALIWPAVTVFALCYFGRELKSWFKRQPKKLSVSKFLEVEWEKAVEEAVKPIQQADKEAAVEEGTATANDGSPAVSAPSLLGTVPVEPMTLRLRDQVNKDPDGAVILAWGEVQSELEDIAADWDFRDSEDHPLPPKTIVTYAVQGRQLPEWFGSTYAAMQKLQRIAVYTGGLTESHAYEFLSLADLLVSELRRRFKWHQLG